MTLLDELGAYLVTAGAGTLNTNLFLSDLPEDPDACAAVIETGGRASQDMFAPGLPAWERPRVQVLVRGAVEDYPGARARADTIWRALTQVTNMVLSGTRYIRITPVQSPFLIGRDSSLRPLISCNYECERVVT